MVLENMKKRPQKEEKALLRRRKRRRNESCDWVGDNPWNGEMSFSGVNL